MKFRIHYTVKTRDVEMEDSVVIEGDTVEECQGKAEAEVTKRGGFDPWSEEIK